MIKTKDGYGKLIGSSYKGDATLVLLSNGGNIGYAIPSTGNTLVQRNTSGQIESSVGDTISPFKITSVKVNENLNSDLLDGFHAAGLFQSLTSTKDKNLTIKIGDTELSINDLYATFDAAGNNIMNKYVTTDTAQNISGTKTFTTLLKFTYSGAPFTVSNATIVTNLNADLLDGTHKSDLFTDFSNVTSGTDINKLSITIGGTTKKVLVNYAQNAGSIGGVTLDNLFTALTSTPAKNLSATIGGITKDITSLYSNYWVFQAIGSKNFNDIHGDTYRGTSWYGDGSNTATNNPLGNGSAFGMQVWRNASGYTAQLIMSSAGRMYVRYYDGTTWSTLKTLAFTSDLSTGGSYWADLPVLTAADATTTPTFAEATATTQVTTPKVHSTGRLTLNATSTALDLKYNNDNTKSVILNGTEFKPFDSANGKLDLGASDARWKGFYAGTGDFTGVVRTTGEGFYLASNGATYSRSGWISTNDGIWIQAATATGSGTKGTLWITGFNNTNLTALKIKADSTDFNGTIGIASDGKIAATNTGSRQAGMYGIYDSTKVGHIWSMGTSYAINANGSNTGNLYGLAYFHTNWSNDSTKNDATKTEVSTYAGNHLAAWVINGKVHAALGNYVWSRNGFIKHGSDNTYALMGGGGHKAIGNVQNTAFYKRETSVNGTVWNMAGTTNSAAFTIYAPTTAGTNGYLLKSNGTGAPVWMDPTTLSIGNADSVDGYHALKSFSSAAEIDNTAFFWTASGAISDVSSMSYAALLNVVGNSTRRWQIWNSRNDHLLYWRPEKADYSGYADVHVLLDNYNFKNYVDDMYWANVKVSSTSSTTTSPTFGGLTVNGTSILNGLVGIGVLSPKAKLAVNTSALSANPSSGSLGTINTMSVGAAGSYGTYFWTRGSGKGYILVGREDGTATVYDLILQVLGGNVGIGTESPSYKLHVNGTTGIAGSLTLTGTTSSTAILKFSRSGASTWNYIIWPGDTAADCRLAFGYSNTSSACYYYMTNASFNPVTNNVRALGTSSVRWSNVYSVLGNFSGVVTASRFVASTANQYLSNGGLVLNNSDIWGLNAIYTQDLADGAGEGYLFKRTNNNYDSIWSKDGTFYYSPDGHPDTGYGTNYIVLHTGNINSYSPQSKIWAASTTVNAWRRILTINGYSNVLLSMCWSLNSQASLHLYLINTGYLTARIIQLGYNGYQYNYSILIRVTYTAATTFHVEVYNSYGYNGATTLSIGCRATVLDNTCSITTITANTAGGGTVASSLTSHYDIAKNFYVERATLADVLLSHDTRNNTITPSTYGNGFRVHFLANGTNGVNDGGNYYGLIHIKHYGSSSDHSGGYPHQIAFTPNNNLWHRIGTSSSAWGSWIKILDTNNYTSTLDGRYVNVTGDTMTGTLILKGSTSADMTYSGNTHPALRFDNSDSSLNIKIIFTDYDNYRSPAGLKVIGNQGNEWFEVSGYMYAAGFVKNGSNNNYALTGGGGHFGIHTGRNNEANKIVRTDGNGHILAGWINTTSGNMGTTAIDRIYCSNDGYIRYKTPANFFSNLSNSGSQISVTVGSQNRTLTVGYSSSSGYIGASSISNLNTPSTWSSDGSRLVYDIYSGSASNKPVSVDNANGLITLFKGKHGTSGQYVTQIAAPDNGRLYTRYSLEGSWIAWKTLAWTSDIPSVGNGTIIINLAGVEKGRFTVNQSGTTTINLTDNNTLRGVENVLTSTSTSNSLTANMGRVLANGGSDRPIVLLAGTLYRNGAGSSYTTWYFTGYRHRSISSTNPTISVSGGVARFYFTATSGYGFSFALVCANHQASGEATAYTGTEYKVRSSGLYWFGTHVSGQYLYIRSISLGDQNNDTAISYVGQWTSYEDGVTRVSIIAVGYAW